MKYLIIDAGNTRIKVVVFEEDNIFFKCVFGELNYIKKIKKIFSENEISKVILSSVGKLGKELEDLLQGFQDILVLTHKTNVPFVNLYKSPETLGVDRIALVSAATIQYPNKNVLVIDAGTCVTFDFKNSHEAYIGGAISPGLNMRYNALNAFTEKLPKLSLTDKEELIGFDTETSIHSGVVNGLVCEIEGVIDRYKSDFSDLTIVLTGGDGYYLSKRFKNSIFANPNFLVEGLNAILIYNTKE
jgi:type III pantothenate kinase